MSHFLPTPLEYLEDNGKNYLRVVALHEMGNLQFYNENRRLVFGGIRSLLLINTAKVEKLQELYIFLRFRVCVFFRAAHLHWSKAVDCALQSSRVIEQWDGVSIGGWSMEKTLKQAGIWGCLHAAGLTAKIAQ